jgi:protein arginine N-methyltransferase 3
VLAAKAGAKHVYAIEASGLAVKARENIVKNGFKDQITYVSPVPWHHGRDEGADDSIIQGKVEDIKLPVKHVDVIVSEWMVCPPMPLHSVMTTDE